jgi:hypothetical protein
MKASGAMEGEDIFSIPILLKPMVLMRQITVDVLDLKPKLDRLPVKNKNELKPLIDKIDAALRQEKKAKTTSKKDKGHPNPFVADLMATKNHKLDISVDGIHTVLRQVHPGHQMAGNAKYFMKNLLEETGNALLKNPVQWTTLKTIQMKRLVDKEQDKAIERLNSYDDSDDLCTKVLEKKKDNFKSGDFPVMLAGLTMHCNTAVRLNTLLEYLCVEILKLAGNASRDHGKMVVNVYFIGMAIAFDDELFQFFEELGITTGASRCMEIPKGYKGYPSLRKDGSQAPPFDPVLCYHVNQTEKKGVDGKLYRTNGKKWEKSNKP